MKTLFRAFVLLMLLSTSATADTVEGVIRQIDRDALTITLSNGTTYLLPGEIDAEAISEGMEVIIAFEEANGENRITDMVFLDD